MALADGATMENKTIKRKNRVISTLIALVVAMLIGIVVLSFFIPEQTEAAKPNIIFILADDMGWNDVGFHGSNQIPTPNIDALAYSGIILNDYYVSPLCTPSRSALMTGKHPIHTGMQHQVIYGFEPYGLSLEERLLPEYLKDEGYSTHLVGKWHLGHFKKEYTPTYRGFDTHFGFWSGHQDYYDHYAEENPAFWGFDMRRDMNVSRDTIGQYTTTLLDVESVKLIKQHDTSKPLFLMVAHAAPHAGNPSIPLQAPDDVVKLFDNEFIPDPRRQKYAAMMWLLDQSIGNLVQALSDKKMLENSIIVFSSDNGGAGGGYNFNVASNWPLRGGKDTTWEGGVKAAALVWSPLIKQSSVVFNKICSIQDWLPTLLSAIKSKAKLKGLDGINIWPALNNPSKKTYSQILQQIDDIRNISAIREDEFKLLIGTTWGGIYDISLGSEGRRGQYNVTLIKNSKTARSIRETRRNLPSQTVMTALRTQVTVKCEKEVEEQLCYPAEGDECLFNLSLDPCESVNVASEYPEVVDKLKKQLEKYRQSAVPPRNAESDPLSNPKFWDYEWTNWKDYPDPPHSESELVMPNTLGMDII